MQRCIGAAFLVAAMGLPLSAQDATVEVGKQAPDFTATGIDGKDFKLSDKLGKGKSIVLLFDRANW